jgi:hypothetical protein
MGSGPAVGERPTPDVMRTLGVDLAAEPPGTAACEIIWHADAAHGRLHSDRLACDLTGGHTGLAVD